MYTGVVQIRSRLNHFRIAEVLVETDYNRGYLGILLEYGVRNILFNRVRPYSVIRDTSLLQFFRNRYK